MPLISIDALARAIPDGARLAVAKDDAGVSIAATRALIARDARNLRLVCVPVSGLQADLLIGAGCVSSIETSAVTLGEFGAAPRFTEAIRRGEVQIIDATCPAIYAGLQASQKGLPFMPLRGIFGSDLLAHRDDWRAIDNPFGEADQIIAVRAIRPQIALFHAQAADQHGNVFLGRERDGLLLAHASDTALVTVERLVEGNLLDDPARAGSVLPAMYVGAVTLAPRASWPIAFAEVAGNDAQWLRDYATQARDPAGFNRMLERLDAQAPWARRPEQADQPA